MLETLQRALAQLPALLSSTEGWQSLDIDYHPPKVERLFRPFEEGRLYLHRIHPCEPEEALYHPHPWPCAVTLLKGRYEMGMGAGPGERPPPRSSRLIAEGPFSYEMTGKEVWHYVRPIGGPVLSVMVAGAPWGRSAPRPGRPLSPLSPEKEATLLADIEAVVA